MYCEWQLLAKKIDPSWITITNGDFMAQNSELLRCVALSGIESHAILDQRQSLDGSRCEAIDACSFPGWMSFCSA